MKITDHIEGLIKKIAANTVYHSIREEAFSLDNEAQACDCGGDPHLEAQTHDYYEGLRDSLYNADSLRSHQNLLEQTLRHRVATCPEPAMPVPPVPVLASDIPSDHPELVGPQWHHALPIWGLIAAGVDGERDADRRKDIAARKNAENRAVCERQAQISTEESYAYALGISADAFRADSSALQPDEYALMRSWVPFIGHSELSPSQTDRTVQFLTASFTSANETDLVCLRTRTRAGQVRAEIYSGASDWKTLVGNIITGFPCYDATFLLGYHHLEASSEALRIPLVQRQNVRVPDLVMIEQQSAERCSVEVHMLSGRSGWQSLSLRESVSLENASSQWSFAMADVNRDLYSDLVGLKTAQSGHLEAHVFSGKARFQQLILKISLPFMMDPSASYRFLMGAGRVQDEANLHIIKHAGDNVNSLSVTLFSAESNFQSPGKTAVTQMHSCDEDMCDFVLSDPLPEGGLSDRFNPHLEIIKKNRTDSLLTERHTLHRLHP